MNTALTVFSSNSKANLLKVQMYSILGIVILPHLWGVTSIPALEKAETPEKCVLVSNHDTTRVHELLKLCDAAINTSEFTKASSYIEEAYALTRQLGYRDGLLSCHNQQGLIQYHLGNYPDALEHFDTALNIAKELGNRNRMADVYSNMGMVHCEMGSYASAIDYHTTALNLRDDTEKREKSVAYNNLGITYYIQGNYTRALDYFLLSLEMDQALGNKHDIAHSLNNIGIFYQYQEKYESALKYLNEANELYAELGIKEGQAGSLSNIGNVLRKLGEQEKALESYLAALRIFEETSNKPGMAMMASNIGVIYHELGQHALAEIYLTSALVANRELDRKLNITTNLNALAHLYTTLHQFEKARNMYTEAIALSKSIGAPDITQNLLLGLTRLDSITGDHLAALQHYKMFIRITDSLERQNNDSLIAEMQGKFESAQKDKEITNLAHEQKMNILRLENQRKSIDLMKTRQEKLETENKMHQQQFQLMENERSLQQLKLTQNQNQLSLLQKEHEIQQSEASKQRLLKNYFIVGLVGITVMGFFIFGYFNTRQRLKMQMLRNKIAIDLHDDVGSTLSSISIFSQMAQQQSKDVTPLLNSIGESSRKMLDAMADIVWTINPENDQFEKIILRMRSFAYELLGAKNIEFEFTAEDDISKLKLPMEVRKNLYLIFKEATNNLVKYAEADKALFEIREEKNILSLMIADNGKGFDMARLTEGNGIKNMKKRAEEIGGRLLIDSVPGRGTTIQLKIAV